MKKIFSGSLITPKYELRFPYSGKLINVNKKEGDFVQKGEAIASLDRRIHQIELDRQLADYEKVRANFELFQLKYGPNDSSDEVKFMRQEKQSALNASVKEVEIAKYHLDQCTLISPTDGIILHMNNLLPLTYITPSSSTIEISRKDSMYFQFELPQKDFLQCTKDTLFELTIDGISYSQNIPFPQNARGAKGVFIITLPVVYHESFAAGMTGKVKRIT